MSKNASAVEPISAVEARQLFAEWTSFPSIVLAVSGGPDSVALMWLAARWRKSLRNGPELIAATVDHGLRREAAREARAVKRLSASLGLAHRTLTWRGPKPKSGIPAAAREARYDLLTRAARTVSAPAIAVAHTQDDQAETILMRLSRGSGIAGLAGMAARSDRGGMILLRPLLDVPKARLIATLKRAKIEFVTDPTNHDAAFTRPRLRALMPALAEEGADAENFARLARRLARANAALEVMADGAERFLRLGDEARHQRFATSFDLEAFAALNEEMRVRLMLRAIARNAQEGAAELGKVEKLLDALGIAQRDGARFKQSLAGALVSIERGRIHIRPAPPRRTGRSKTARA